ncbi:MAG: DUF5677 domain-containing protein [Chloroflexi bacterium]|nr:DUF5677 domain-containing protein [Chloroflexota bacterium]
MQHVFDRVRARWEIWSGGSEEQFVYEVIGGLLARQATLASEFAQNPGVWNPHSAPLFFRSMVDNLITLAWILKEPEERTKQFVLYGLGQENLLLEHRKASLQEEGQDPDEDTTVKDWERQLNSERYTFLTEVNVGSLGPSSREMAEETELLELHRMDYAHWSGTTHNMWQHIVRFNLRQCENPLHGYHRIPLYPYPIPMPELLLRAAEYFDQSIDIFDKATKLEVGDLSANEVLEQEFERMPAPPFVPSDGSA